MFTIDTIGDSGFKEYTFPPSTQGTIYIRVKDTNQLSGETSLDTLHIDQLYIRSETLLGTPPLAPTDFSASAISGNLVQLGWTDNADDEFGYYIYRSLDGANWILIDIADANSENFMDSTALPDTTYSYRVQAYNGSGTSSFSNIATTSTPAGLALTGFGYKEKNQYLIYLSWSGGSGPNYDIYRDNYLIYQTIAGSTEHTDSVSSRGNYLYQVCEAGSTIECSNYLMIDF